MATALDEMRRKRQAIFVAQPDLAAGQEILR
jgi:hypothetical protein